MLLSSPGQAITLETAVGQGLAIHPSVAAARAEVEAAGTDVDIARDGYWPTVQASAGPENALWGEFGYDLTASQMLYDWGRVSSQVESASAAERQQLEAFKVTSDEAALDIIEVYLDVLLYESRLAAAEHHIERLADLAELSHDRSGLGYVGRGEAERAELELARAREQRAIEKGSLVDARAQFRELVDRPPDDLSWPDSISMAGRLRDPDELDAAVAEAPAFRRAHEEVEAAQADREESRAALKPQLNLEGSLLRREIGGRMEEDAVVALRVRMDAFQGLSNFRRVEAAGRRVDAARWKQRATRRELRRELSTWIEQDEVFGWRLDSLQAQLDNAKEVANAYREQFEVGLRDIDDLLPIQRDLFETERQLAEIRSQKLRIQYRVASRLGQLDEVLHADEENGQGVP
ncbi:MAG: TolC family protein [Pseudomonadota bacterium]